MNIPLYRYTDIVHISPTIHGDKTRDFSCARGHLVSLVRFPWFPAEWLCRGKGGGAPLPAPNWTPTWNPKIMPKWFPKLFQNDTRNSIIFWNFKMIPKLVEMRFPRPLWPISTARPHGVQIASEWLPMVLEWLPNSAQMRLHTKIPSEIRNTPDRRHRPRGLYNILSFKPVRRLW